MRRFSPWAGWAAAAAFCLLTASVHAISSAVNISTRMMVETGDNVLIGGFIVYGTGQKNIAVRAIGPSLPIAGALSDPILEFYDATGAIVASNDNWRSSQESALKAVGLAPTNDFNSASPTRISASSARVFSGWRRPALRALRESV